MEAALNTEVGNEQRHPEAIPAGRWVIDPTRSHLAFAAVRPLATQPVHGLFRQFDGALEIDDRSARPRAHLIIKVESLDTGDAETNASLIANDRLDAFVYPEIRLELDSATSIGQGYWRLGGRITIRQHVRQIDLDAVLTDLSREGDARRLAVEIFGRLGVDGWIGSDSGSASRRALACGSVRLHLSLSLVERPVVSGLDGLEMYCPGERG